MAFDQTPIDDPRVSFADAELSISWTSSAPAGTWYQVYCNRELAWSGQATNARLPWPYGRCQIDIGAVDHGADAITDYSGSLAGGSSNRAVLNWEGGSFQSSAIDHFLIYAGIGTIDYGKPIGRVPAYHAGVRLDGYGMGGYGRGGYGHAASSYAWTSDTLSAGAWQFAVVPVDVAGNAAGSPATTTVTITAPPRPPASDTNGVRLHASVNPTTRVPTLTWSASP